MDSRPHSLSRRDSRLRLSMLVAVSLITLIGFMAWRMGCEPLTDDWAYKRIAVSDDDFWSCRGPEVTAASDLIPSMVEHYRWVNGRIANDLVIVLMWAPRWIGALVLALSALAMLLLTIKVANPDRPLRRTPVGITAAAVALMWLAYPWSDTMQAVSFAVNYVMSSVLALLCMLAVMRIPWQRRWGFAGSLFLGFFTGWWHESFGTVLIAFSTIYALIDWPCGLRRRLTFVTALALGTAICALAPGTLLRASAQLGNAEFWPYITYAFTRYARQTWPVWLALVLMIVAMHRTHDKSQRTMAIALTVAMIVTIAQSIVLEVMYRGLWPADLMASVMILMAIDQRRQLLRRPWPLRWRSALSAMLVLGYAWWMCQLVCYQHRTAADVRLLHEQALRMSADAVPGQVIHANVHSDDYEPWYLLGITDRYITAAAWPNYVFGGYHFGTPGFGLVPTTTDPSAAATLMLPGHCGQESFRATIVLGAPLPAASPMARVMMHIFAPGEMRLPVKISAVDVTDSLGRPWTVCIPQPLGITARHRQVLDLIPDEPF